MLLFTISPKRTGRTYPPVDTARSFVSCTESGAFAKKRQAAVRAREPHALVDFEMANVTSICGCTRDTQTEDAVASGWLEPTWLPVMCRLQTAVWIKHRQQLDAEEHLKQTVQRQAKEQHRPACLSDRPLPWKPPLPGQCRCVADLLLRWLPLWVPQCWALPRCAAAFVESNRPEITWNGRRPQLPLKHSSRVGAGQARIAKGKQSASHANMLQMAAEAPRMEATVAVAVSAALPRWGKQWPRRKGARIWFAV